MERQTTLRLSIDSLSVTCAREAHYYIIPYLPAFVNPSMVRNYADYHYDRELGGLRETHTHDYLPSTLLLILSNGHYWIRTNDLLDVNEML